MLARPWTGGGDEHDCYRTSGAAKEDTDRIPRVPNVALTRAGKVSPPGRAWGVRFWTSIAKEEKKRPPTTDMFPNIKHREHSRLSDT
jgi:hypothetical protein